MRRDELRLPLPPNNDRPGDRWMCGRRGGQQPCLRGPSDRGVCPMEPACQVRRSWYGRRRRALLIATLILLGILLFMMRSPHQLAIIKPGNLSNPHAQILADTITSQRCAACHPQATDPDKTWFNGSSEGHQQVTQTDACLDCHHKTMPRSVAKLAHNLNAEQLAELKKSRTRLASLSGRSATWQDLLPGPAVELDNIRCATCHREHHGATANLLAISDVQCQTCHTDRFGSFATSHPDWHDWPYGRGGDISFNHATHANKYFPADRHEGNSKPFECGQCHQRHAKNEITRATSYQVGCATCHEKALKLETVEGLDLLILPVLSRESANRVQPWPEAATGFYDGPVSPLTELLLQADPVMAEALQKIPAGDFAGVSTPESMEAAETLARGIRELLEDIGSNGQSALIQRADRLGLSPESIQTLLRPLSPQLVQTTQQRWFGNQNDNRQDSLEDKKTPLREQHAVPQAEGDDDLLDGLQESDHLLETDLSSGDSLLSPSLTTETDPLDLEPLGKDNLLESGSPEESGDDPASHSLSGVPFDADKMLPAGGWFRDDQRMAIQYRGTGHDDPVLKALIDIIRQLPEGMPTRQRLIQNKAVASCITCHPGAIRKHGRWRSEPRSDMGQFTKFSHASHLNVAELSNCIHCHRVADGASPALSITEVVARAPHANHEFLPLTREACSGCHRKGASGDNCTTCHRYHIDLPGSGANLVPE